MINNDLFNEAYLKSIFSESEDIENNEVDTNKEEEQKELNKEGIDGAIAGGAETFLGKNKGRTVEQKLVRITKVLAVVFFVLSLIATLIVLFVS